MVTNISSNMIILPKNVHLSEDGCLPRRKHILLVPDYFTSAEDFANEELRKRLQLYCGDTAVFYAEDEIEKAREEVEETCKKSLRLDLLVTIGSGCLLATGITSLPRLFIDPNWLAGEAHEIDAAIRMAAPSNIKTGDRPALGWITEIGSITCNPCEHVKRFGTVYYPEGIELDSDEGLDKICQEINNLLSSLEA